MLLQGHDILAFTYADWHASWSTPQQIMSRLAPQNRVLFVDQPRSFLYGIKRPDPQGAGVWQGPRLQEVRPNLLVYHPPHCFLPVGRLPLSLAKVTLRLNGRRLARLVGKQMRKLGIRRPILWNFSPLHGKAVPHLPRRLAIYDICDEWASYVPDRSGKEVLRWIEEALTRQADLVFVGSENMLQKRAGLNPEMHVVYHAADFAHFSRAASPNTAVPRDLAGLPRPIIGAIGVMDCARFDVDLVAAVAAARPQWSIVLVGPARPGLDLTRLKACANVYLLGNRAVEELPAYLRGMDVALIPYQMNDATANIYPLKLQEYLSGAKPVVSPPLPSVRPYGNVVYLADGPEECVKAVERALAEDTAERREARQAVARENSWEQRVEEKSRHVLRKLQDKMAAEGANAV